METQNPIAVGDDLKKIIADSRLIALRLGNSFISSSHLLLALLEKEHQHLAPIFSAISLPVEAVRTKVSEKMKASGEGGEITMGNVPVAPEAETVLQQTFAEFARRQGLEVGGVHLLLAMTAIADSDAADALSEYGVTYEKVEKAVGSW